jgi:hypothetical protein
LKSLERREDLDALVVVFPAWKALDDVDQPRTFHMPHAERDLAAMQAPVRRLHRRNLGVRVVHKHPLRDEVLADVLADRVEHRHEHVTPSA